VPAASATADELVLPQLVSEVYEASTPPLRARLLECLLRPMRPLGLVAIAAGAFGGFVHREPWDRISVPLDDAVRFSAEQVLELARFVEQVQPEALGRLAAIVADNPLALQTLSGSLLLLAARRWLPAVATPPDA
jgi:hypothetical protein